MKPTPGPEVTAPAPVADHRPTHTLPPPKTGAAVLDDCRRTLSPGTWLSVELAERAIAAATKRAASWFGRLQEEQGLVLAAHGFDLCREQTSTAEVDFCVGRVVDADGQSGACLRVSLDARGHGSRRWLRLTLTPTMDYRVIIYEVRGVELRRWYEGDDVTT
ncbi:MAG: hypothetical protein ACI9MR_004131 [Myxococcota bacterium]